MLHHIVISRRFCFILGCLTLQALIAPRGALAINITVDYRYDSNNFFNTQQKKDALQAAANRYSGIITQSLFASTLSDGSTNDPRIGFTHPGTGVMDFQVSSATSAASDFLVTNAGAAAANEYRGPWSIAANEWILYAGGRPLSVAGVGGTGTGSNFDSVYLSGSSHLNRGFRSSGSVNHLPVWGGAITFDSDGSTNWHFNPDTTPPAGSTDFYTIALHEIGHALGLSAQSTDWDSLKSGSQFLGPQTVAAYNADNGTSLSSLSQVSSTNRHFQDGIYDSRIFQNASPKLVATVGTGALQDLLMEPTANFTSTVRRFELTNVDVAALRDLGWSTVSQTDVQPGDYNKNGIVDAADFVVWRKGVADGNYATWRANFGETLSGSSAINSPGFPAVPEPTSWLIVASACSAIFASRRPLRRC